MFKSYARSEYKVKTWGVLGIGEKLCRTFCAARDEKGYLQGLPKARGKEHGAKFDLAFQQRWNTTLCAVLGGVYTAFVRTMKLHEW